MTNEPISPVARPYFNVPLNLPHAGRIANRILKLLYKESADPVMMKTVIELQELLEPAVELDDNPALELAIEMRERAAVIARRLVVQIEAGNAGNDRLGQCVRNLFECLELGAEGADISLRAGENPRSLQRPY